MLKYNISSWNLGSACENKRIKCKESYVQINESEWWNEKKKQIMIFFFKSQVNMNESHVSNYTGE